MGNQAVNRLDSNTRALLCLGRPIGEWDSGNTGEHPGWNPQGWTGEIPLGKVYLSFLLPSESLWWSLPQRGTLPLPHFWGQSICNGLCVSSHFQFLFSLYLHNSVCPLSVSAELSAFLPQDSAECIHAVHGQMLALLTDLGPFLYPLSYFLGRC